MRKLIFKKKSLSNLWISFCILFYFPSTSFQVSTVRLYRLSTSFYNVKLSLVISDCYLLSSIFFYLFIFIFWSLIAHFKSPCTFLCNLGQFIYVSPSICVFASAAHKLYLSLNLKIQNHNLCRYINKKGINFEMKIDVMKSWCHQPLKVERLCILASLEFPNVYQEGNKVLLIANLFLQHEMWDSCYHLAYWEFFCRIYYYIFFILEKKSRKLIITVQMKY